MTPKQKRFVEEYLIDKNATQAAIRAGYSEKTAGQIGEQNLRKLVISAAIKKAVAEQSARTQVTADRVVEELAKIGFLNMQDYIELNDNGDAFVDLSRLTREQAAAISEITVDEYVEGKGRNAREVKKTRIKLADKKGALDLLGKHFGIFEKDNRQRDVKVVIRDKYEARDGME
ncbi:MAG: terminase small subunit [Deltaproteobacteria bacterium]|nr:terminase small subunit [Deltaproteobacteria bacterium]